MVDEWIRLAESAGVELKDLEMSKDDMNDAFSLLDFNPLSAELMTVRITSTLALVHASGNFGWTGLPGSYGLTSQAIRRKVRSKIIKGVIHVWVDDWLIVSIKGYGQRNQLLFQEYARNILGPTAINAKKILHPASIVDNAVGWKINFEQESLRINDKGVDKLFFVFFLVDESRPLNLRMYQLMASLAERYSHGLRCMRPFVSSFNKMIGRFETKTSKSFRLIKPDSQTKFCIEMWRVVSLLLWRNREAFCVPLRSISRLYSSFPPHGLIISDKGPTMMGAAVLDPVTQEIVVYTQLSLPFSDLENLYQNLGEYQGHLLSLILYRLYKSDFTYSRLAFVGAINPLCRGLSHTNAILSSGKQRTSSCRGFISMPTSIPSRRRIVLAARWVSLIN